ncbi:acetylglutamate kinase, partial [Schumannella luteola]
MTNDTPIDELDPRTADAAVKADTLIQSLPWLLRFSGRIVVVKFGGNAMVDRELQRA